MTVLRYVTYLSHIKLAKNSPPFKCTLIASHHGEVGVKV